MAKAPRFWYRPPGAMALALWPAGALYAIGADLRDMMTRPFYASVPVICVGNPTVGGAGKTPAALAVADALSAMGFAPHFLTRGYGGRMKGPCRVDAEDHGAGEVGDEPLILARHAPTHVSRDRAAGARQAAAEGAKIIVMDDGFQNPTLHKDFSFLVVDGAAGVGNGQVLPAGPLRAPLGGQMARADALVVVGAGAAGEAVAAVAVAAGVPVLKARLQPDPAARDLDAKFVFAFSGIGRPAKFLETLAGLGAKIAGHREFADHHAYRTADIAEIISLAEQARADTIVTTEKDYARLDENNDPRGRFRARLSTVPVSLKFDTPAELDALLQRVLPMSSRPKERRQDGSDRSR